MKLSIRAMAAAGGALWGGALLSVGLVRLAWPTYGGLFLDALGSVYPGFPRGAGVGPAMVEGLYGAVDGAAAGSLLAAAYNLAVGRFQREGR